MDNRIRLIICLLVSCVLCAACGGGGSADGSTFSDPAGAEAEPAEDATDIVITSVNAVTGETSATVNALQPLRFEISVRDGKNRPRAGVSVDVTTTIGEFNGDSGSFLTNSRGMATAELSVTSESPSSAGTITASYGEEASEEAYFQVGLAPVIVGAELDGVFVEGQVAISEPEIPVNGKALINFAVVDMAGNPLDHTLTPVISGGCLDADPARSQITQITSLGLAAFQAVYAPDTCLGSDDIAVSFEELPGHDASGSLTIVPETAVRLAFFDASSTNLSVTGLGATVLATQSLLQFEVTSSSGDPVADTLVEFALSAAEAYASLDTYSARSNDDGIVSVVLTAGTLPSVATVSATITTNTATVTVYSSEITITTGRPSGRGLSLSATPLNPGGFDFDGVLSVVAVSVSDHFGRPVPDGTTAYFLSEYGSVEASCQTVDGRCEIQWTSQSPRLPAFSSFTGTDGKPGFVRTLDNTLCVRSGYRPATYPCPVSLGQPIGGRNTLIAYLDGDESFVDANGNGLYDIGEEFEDVPEVFVDFNEDGEFGAVGTVGSCSPDCSIAGGDEEAFIDANGDGQYSTGDGIYNGSLCGEEAEQAGLCNKAAVTLSASNVIVMSSINSYGGFFSKSGEDYTPIRSIDMGAEDYSTYFLLSDYFNGVLPAGTTVEFSSSSCQVLQPQSYQVPSTNKLGPIVIPVVLQGGLSSEELSGELIVSVSLPESSGTSQTDVFRLPCTVDACSSLPQPSFCL